MNELDYANKGLKMWEWILETLTRNTDNAGDMVALKYQYLISNDPEMLGFKSFCAACEFFKNHSNCDKCMIHVECYEYLDLNDLDAEDQPSFARRRVAKNLITAHKRWIEAIK